MIAEITETCFTVEIFITEFFNIIYRRYLGLTAERLEEITISDDPSVNDHEIAFLLLTSSCQRCHDRAMNKAARESHHLDSTVASAMGA